MYSFISDVGTSFRSPLLNKRSITLNYIFYITNVTFFYKREINPLTIEPLLSKMGLIFFCKASAIQKVEKARFDTTCVCFQYKRLIPTIARRMNIYGQADRQLLSMDISNVHVDEKESLTRQCY